MPNGMKRGYQRWAFDKFEDYWKFDDSERHNIMLNYFLQCEVLKEGDPKDELLLTAEAMDQIIKALRLKTTKLLVSILGSSERCIIQRIGYIWSVPKVAKPNSPGARAKNN